MQVGCAMVGRGELGFVLATESLEAGMLEQRAYCATVWALVLATLLGPVAFRLSLRVPQRVGTGEAGTGSATGACAGSSNELGTAATLADPADGAAVLKADGALQEQHVAGLRTG